MDFTEILSLVIKLLVVLATGILIPFLNRKVGAENLAKAAKYVSIFVAAADQIFNVDDGEKKKQYVLNLLAQKGIRLDGDALDAMVEAAVLELHNALGGVNTRAVTDYAQQPQH